MKSTSKIEPGIIRFLKPERSKSGMVANIKFPFILVDGSSYLFRAFHAIPALANSEGEPTGAIYGVVSMLKKLLSDYKPTHVAVVFDAKAKTFRHELYPQYKANRPPMDEELAVQIAPLHRIVTAMGLPLIMMSGVEADDVIGTLAKQCTTMPVLISTGDKDMMQLVNKNIFLINTMTNTFTDEEGVFSKFGVRPDQVIDYLTLVGDLADNVPGVPKVGPKTAVKLLSQYGNLSNIILHASEIKGSIGAYFIDKQPELLLSQKLITIKNDVLLDASIDKFAIRPPEVEKLREYYSRFNFKKWELELIDIKSCNTKKKINYEIILTKEKLTEWVNKIKNA
jgi:DNA polymerase-1